MWLSEPHALAMYVAWQRRGPKTPPMSTTCNIVCGLVNSMYFELGEACQLAQMILGQVQLTGNYLYNT